MLRTDLTGHGLRPVLLAIGCLFGTIPILALSPFLAVPPLYNLALGAFSAAATVLICTSVLRILRRQQELQAQRTNLALEVSALNAHAIVSLTDQNMRLCYVNQKFLEATAYTAKELLGRAPFDFYADDSGPEAALINDRLRAGLSWSGETRLRRKDGSTVHTQTTIMPRVGRNGEWLGSVAVRTDITQMRIASAEHDTVATLHNLSEPVAMFCPRRLTLLYMNQAAMDIVGWDSATYPKKTVNDVEFGLDVEHLQAQFEGLRRGETDQAVFRIDIGGRTFEASVQLIAPNAGAARFFAILRDMSTEVELARAKEDFISTVSHELRTPLTSIKGALGLLLSGAAGELNPKSRNLMEIAHRNADRLVLIVNDILDLEKIAAGKMEFRRVLGDLRDALREAVEANRPYADQFNVKLQFDDIDGPVLADFDQDRMLQVLANLLSNAVKFSRAGGTVVAGIRTEDALHRVFVRDSGVGIPAAALATIFERFNQAGNVDRRTTGGTGLGLSIVKAIVEKHGGEVSLSSEEGVGTTVMFTIPKAVESFPNLRLLGTSGASA